MNLFENQELPKPLPIKCNPKDLNDIIGQEKTVRIIREILSKNIFQSMIFFGPPGIGKTALARIISKRIEADFISINAVVSNLADIKNAIKQGHDNLIYYKKKTILFIDEIHRFSRLHQDALLPGVENGLIYLIGATTENPFFSIIPALRSRVHIFEFKKLSNEDLNSILKRILSDKENGYGKYKVSFPKNLQKKLFTYSNGDARRMLNILELLFSMSMDGEKIIVNQEVFKHLLSNYMTYDRKSIHFDTISAFIKSMRGSDPDASIYYLAKMLKSGEDFLYIGRRILISAFEDVGLANPNCAVQVKSAVSAAEQLGMPEARIPLAFASLIVACSPKSNSAYSAIDKALEYLNENDLDIPIYLRQNSAEKNKYKYPHAFNKHYVKQKYVSKKNNFYVPGQLGFEKRIQHYLKEFLHFYDDKEELYK